MKKKLTLVILLISIKVCSQDTAQIKITYETKIISDSLNKEKFEIYDCTLLANESKSIYFFENAKTFFNRNINEVQKINTSLGQILRYPKYVASVLRFDDKITAFLPVGKYIFKFTEPELKWKILNERKQILGYECILAETKTDSNEVFYAWFSEDIPLSDGPFRFKGLSGLILEVYNKNNTIKIVATEVEKSKEEIELIRYTNLVETRDKKQYLEARKNYIENPSIYNGNIKIFDAAGKDVTNRISERLKKVNVYLD